MASIINVDQIAEATSGSGVKIPGHVIQVVQSSYSTEETSTSSTFANTSFTGTITPKNSTSKVLALCQVGFMSYANTGNQNMGTGRLYRDASNTSGIIVSGGYNYGGNGVLINHTAALNWLDSPATTSATTYTFQIAHITGTETRINYGTNVASFMILMEIAQ